MPSGAIGAVRHMMQNLDVTELEGYLESLLGEPDHSLRNALRDYAESHEILL